MDLAPTLGPAITTASAQLSAAVDKLVASLPVTITEAEQPIIDAAKAELAAAIAGLQTVESPILAEVSALRQELTDWRLMIAGLLHNGIKLSALSAAAGAIQ